MPQRAATFFGQWRSAVRRRYSEGGSLALSRIYGVARVSNDPTISQDDDDLRRARERSSQRLRPPIDVPGYEFERFLGAGAYGEVWVAVDRNTGRRTAVKFYTHRGGLDWSLLSREVEKLAFLFADRYVVQLMDVGWNADPPYYVMEYLERGSLADRLETGPLPPRQALSLFRDVTIGLVHAHDKGVLHCDLKPANVLLDQDDRPRLADFGQSRLSHEQQPALGTLFYMAPEQADLEAVPDARWDVYALGALFYCMLTGEPPFRDAATWRTLESHTELAAKLAAYRRALQATPLSMKPLRDRGVDRDLIEIIERCLATSPLKRYPNPQAVLAALDAREVRRARRPLLVLGALGPAVLLAVLSWYAWSVYGTAVGESDETLVRRAQESNGFAAQFVAETAAAEIEQRWHHLENEADDETIRDVLQRIATASALADSDRAVAQAWLERAAAAPEDLKTASWVVTDARGNQLARVPFDKKTIGQNYAYRDYFHGRGTEQPTTGDVAPIRAPHLSNVFTSTATRERKVAFSVPIWSRDADRAKRRVVGVLSVTIALGQFAELKTDGASDTSPIAVLVDLRPDSDGRVGSILEHPYLTQLLHDAAAPGSPEATSTPTAWYFEAKEVARLRSAIAAARRSDSFAALEDANYRDPLDGEEADRWLAAFRPVLVNKGATEAVDSGWLVIVQEPYATVVRPARELGRTLVRYGITALGFVVGVVTALWGFVMIVLNESPRVGWMSRVRRRLLGSTTADTASGDGSAREPVASETAPFRSLSIHDERGI